MFKTDDKNEYTKALKIDDSCILLLFHFFAITAHGQTRHVTSKLMKNGQSLSAETLF